MRNTSHKNPLRGDAGFSMVEIAVVVSVFSLAFIAALPSFQTSLRGHRLQSSANQMETQLRMMRSRAVAEDTPYIVAMNPGSDEYFFVRDDNRDGTPDWGVETSEGPITLPEGIDVEYVNANDFDNDVIVFNPDGSTNLNGQLVLEDAKENKIYIDIIQPSGVINVLSQTEYATAYGTN